MDYYKILDIPENASEDDIKREYRKLAMKYHPDRNPENREAEERFKKIGEAYEILGNKEKRRKYDEKRKKDKNLSQEKRERGKTKSEKEFKRVFSADPKNIKNMFEKAFNINDLNNLEEKEGKEHKENIEKIFEKFFKIKSK